MMFPAVGAAQEILVTVSPTQPVLPPQALLYLDNPSKFFNIRITNLTSKVQNIYLGLDLTQVIPDNRMSMKTPPMRMPRNPLTLNPNQTKILTRGEARQLFAHLLLSEVSMSGGVLTDYTNGIMALLPEGTYSGRITAYRYDPSLRHPYVLSNPNSGFCQFQICVFLVGNHALAAEDIQQLIQGRRIFSRGLPYTGRIIHDNTGKTECNRKYRRIKSGPKSDGRHQCHRHG